MKKTPKPSQMELEKELIARAIDPETRDDAFNELYKIHSEQLRGVAFPFLKNDHDVDDAVQLAFLKAHRGMATYVHNRPFSSWLSTICANLCKDILQSKKRRREIYETGGNNDKASVGNSFIEQSWHTQHKGHSNKTFVDQIELDQKLRKIIYEALESLSEKHRTIIHMVDFDGWTYAQCASVLNIPIGTVMSRVSFARDYFVSAMEKRGITKGALGSFLDEEKDTGYW